MFFSIFQFEDIDIYKKNYDKSANLVYLERRKVNDVYFSLNIHHAHNLLESVEYAIILLKENTSESLKTADAILNTVLSFQNKDPKSSQYSYFPEFTEAILPDILKDDYGTTFKIVGLFLQILLEYKPLLTDELVLKLRESCYATAFYASLCSNISIYNYASMRFLEAYVLLQAGNLFKKPDFINAGIITLNTIYSGIKYNENFWEYGSCYDYYLFSELLILIKRASNNDKNCINMADELYDLLWKNIALNFHLPLCRMTGPQSDQTKALMGEYFLLFLEKAVGIHLYEKKTNFKFPDNILSRCPQKYVIYFMDNTPNRFIHQLIGRGSTYLYFTISQIAFNYMQPEYAAGCFNREEFWRAHTPFAAYFKSYESSSPYFITLKVLNNSREYSAAELHCMQNKGTILGHIIFCTNRGDVHPDIISEHGMLLTSDLRIRFEISGNINNLQIISDKSSITVKYRNITVRYKIPIICMDNIPVSLELKKYKNHLYFDAVFNVAPDTKIDLRKIKKAICQFVFQITATNKSLNEETNTFENGFLISKLSADDLDLRIESPYKPNCFEFLNTHDRQYINNLRIEQYIAFNNSKTVQYNFIASSNADIAPPPFSDSDAILSKLENLKRVNIDNINVIIKGYLDNLLEKNFTLDIFKRYAVHIIILLFERASSENFQFERIIKNNYYDIYQKISDAPNADKVCSEILKITDKIQKENIELNIKIKKTNIVSDVISIIDNNFQNPLLSLSMIAEMLGVNEYYISRAFKKNTNTNYVKYLIRVRMEKAKELLDNNVPADMAAKECGYMNIFSFKRAFKLYTGMTITEWKKHQKI